MQQNRKKDADGQDIADWDRRGLVAYHGCKKRKVVFSSLKTARS